MRRSLWSRLLAGWLLCWLPLVLADSGWLHACPMHGAAPGAAVHAVHAADAVSMHPASMHDVPETTGHDMAAHTARAHAPGDQGHPQGHQAGHACTCAGACCTPMTALVAVEPALVTPVTDVRVVVPTAARSEAEYVAAWVDFVLPFATAPPARASA